MTIIVACLILIAFLACLYIWYTLRRYAAIANEAIDANERITESLDATIREAFDLGYATAKEHNPVRDAIDQKHTKELTNGR